jgi:hypothetical protein
MALFFMPNLLPRKGNRDVSTKEARSHCPITMTVAVFERGEEKREQKGEKRRGKREERRDSARKEG